MAMTAQGCAEYVYEKMSDKYRRPYLADSEYPQEAKDAEIESYRVLLGSVIEYILANDETSGRKTIL
jgi:hypothetical protein